MPTVIAQLSASAWCLEEHMLTVSRRPLSIGLLSILHAPIAFRRRGITA